MTVSSLARRPCLIPPRTSHLRGRPTVAGSEGGELTLVRAWSYPCRGRERAVWRQQGGPFAVEPTRRSVTIIGLVDRRSQTTLSDDGGATTVEV